MKKLYNILTLMVIAIFLLSSCKEEEKSSGFAINKDVIEINENGGLELVEVTGNVKWQASSEDSWLRISPANGIGSSTCEVKIDSSVEAAMRYAKIKFMAEGMATPKVISVKQSGFAKGVFIDEPKETYELDASAKLEKRVLEIEATANVDFKVKVEAKGDWLTYKKEDLDYDYGYRPRSLKLHFDWLVNMQDKERTARVIITPAEGDDNVVVLNISQKAAPTITDDRAGDSLAILAIYDSMNGIHEWDTSEDLMYWEGVSLWKSTDPEVKKDRKLLGRLKSVDFSIFETYESLPFQVKFLKTARSIRFFGNANTFLKSIKLGEDICGLAQYGNLKELTISAYGLSELPSSFVELGKTLEYLDLGYNNFTYDKLELLTPENFPHLKFLHLNKLNRFDSTNDLTKSTVDSIGFRMVTGFGEGYGMTGNFNNTFFQTLLKWDNLEALSLTLNLLEGHLPTDAELVSIGISTYDEKDFDKSLALEEDAKKFIDTISTAKPYLLGAPKVWPRMKNLKLNECFLTGDLPQWVLYHPYLSFWNPMQLIFAQGNGFINTKKETAKFDNEPLNLNNYANAGLDKAYYDLYPLRKPKLVYDDDDAE